MPQISFNLMRQNVNKQKEIIPFNGYFLSLDPGQTTGWATWYAEPTFTKLIGSGQIDTYDVSKCTDNFGKLLKQFKPALIVFESYRVYSWKSDDHKWSDVPTLRNIGCIETICHLSNIPTFSQTAQQAKNFVTDDFLQKVDMYKKGERHARDAIRHGLYGLLFSPLQQVVSDYKKPS